MAINMGLRLTARWREIKLCNKRRNEAGSLSQAKTGLSQGENGLLQG